MSNPTLETLSSTHPQTFDSSHAHELEDVEKLTNELKRLLVKHENILNEHGIRSEVEVLERWMESYRRGLSAARKISETGTSLLSDLRTHLKLAIEERHRLEDEGGNPSSGEEYDRIDELTKTVRRIEGVLPGIENIFHPTETVREPEEA